ncbi:MAG: sigma-70 family RNA polymerase sigma factor [Bacteroidetes bacterium]|nr:sigma-70 family RNA polymerase sigma factor [Bacteroidota bacterium]
MDKKQAFLQVIEKNKALLYKVAGFYTDSPQDREDLFQEIVYQLWKSFESFNNASGISTWMYRVAMNTAIYFLRKSQRRPPVVSMREELLEIPEPDETSMDQRFRTLHEHIKGLNLLEKGIVMLYLEGKSYEEIAGLIGISSSNVGTRLSRIRERLKKQIAKTI